MGRHTLSDAKIFFGGYDLSGSMNEVSLLYGAPLKPATAFGDTGEARRAGLPDVSLGAQGYWDSTIDAALQGKIGVTDDPVSVAPLGESEGDIAYLFRAAAGEYRLGGQVGEMFPFALDAQGSAGAALVRGTLMHRASRTSTANGTAQQVGAVAADESIYAALHVFSVSGTGGPTLDVTVESDDAEGFASAVTRITFTQATGITAEWKSLAGAVTDDWWRIAWTIAGTDPEFDFAVVLGIR